MNRKPSPLIIGALVVLLVLSGGLALFGAARPASAQDAVAWEVLSLVNQARAAAGIGPLAMNGALVAAAQRHSTDMASAGFVGHTGSDGSTAAQRVSDAGYTWAALGENAAQTWSVSAQEVFNLWMGSEGHRANMLNPAFVEMGLGYAAAANGAVYYTLTFGAQPGAAPPPVQEQPTLAAAPPTSTPLPPPPTVTALPSATPPPTPVPASLIPPTAASLPTLQMTPLLMATLAAAFPIPPANPGVIQLIEAPGIPWTLWFQALPPDYRPVNAQGITLLPEDGIPPELWFQVPPALP
jgi:uncharacterized protein YkwD